jgi:hypothetical protein
MKPPEIFGVVVRAIGLCALLCGLYWLLSGTKETVYFTLSSLGVMEEQNTYAISYFVDGGATVLVGLFLLRKTEVIVKLAYPEKPNDISQPSA